MTPEELQRLLGEYRDGTIGPEDARRLADAIREGGDGVMSEIEWDGLIAQAFDGSDEDAFVRSFNERLRAEGTATDFVETFERKAIRREPTPTPFPAVRARRLRAGRTSRSSGPGMPLGIFAGVAAGVLFCIVVFNALRSAPPAPHVRPLADRVERIPEGEPLPISKPPWHPARAKAQPPKPEPAPTAEGSRRPPAPAPRPDPRPAPNVAPLRPPRVEPPPPSPRQKTVTVVATLDSASTGIRLLTPEGERPARAGDSILSGTGVSVPTGSSATVLYPDRTRLELMPDTTISAITADDRGQKLIVLERGIITASVTKQPAGRPTSFRTPHGVAIVLGTELTLSAGEHSTRLDVTKGRVRLTRSADGASTVVRSGHYALAAEGLPLRSRPFPRLVFSEDFRDPRKSASRWITFTSGPPNQTYVSNAALRMDLSNATARWENWYAVTKQSFPLGRLHVRVKVRFSDALADLSAAISLYDTQDNGRGDRDHIEFYARRNGVSLRVLRYGNDGSKNGGNFVSLTAGNHPGVWQPGKWMNVAFTVDPKEMTVRVDGRPLYSGPHPIQDLRRLRIGLYGGLKNTTQPCWVEFSDVRVQRQP